ncbi:MAG: type II toxin-antitoxin system VapB family antitoxin [Cyclobacteriaceae bacterium]
MRTNIDINDTLLKEAMDLTHAKTKRELIHLALNELIHSRKRQSILKFKGKLTWEGNLDDMRS